jgi:hypothetical protein
MCGQPHAAAALPTFHWKLAACVPVSTWFHKTVIQRGIFTDAVSAVTQVVARCMCGLSQMSPSLFPSRIPSHVLFISVVAFTADLRTCEVLRVSGLPVSSYFQRSFTFSGWRFIPVELCESPGSCRHAVLSAQGRGPTDRPSETNGHKSRDGTAFQAPAKRTVRRRETYTKMERPGALWALQERVLRPELWYVHGDCDLTCVLKLLCPSTTLCSSR